MRQPKAAKGAAFDRAFVSMMTGHHQGAMTTLRKILDRL
ncbi:DUF305 domain-containing protein [Streptomyces sp. NPDC005393]